ncbi:MAG: tetratricopeptide repeat protein [Bacteroidia bacterium]|nr:tetratricopeptide repeat protein [Bacteroidia bacterium]
MKKDIGYRSHLESKKGSFFLRILVMIFLAVTFFPTKEVKAYSNDSLSSFLQRNKFKVKPLVLDTLLQESESILYKNPRRARRHAEGVLLLAGEKKKFGVFIGLAHKLIGNAYVLENEHELGLKSLEESEVWFDSYDNRGELAQVKNLKGACYQGLGDTKMAIALGFQALMVFEKSGPDQYYASALENIGNLFYSQKKYEEAREYYVKALGIRQSQSDSGALARTLLSIANIETELFNFRESKDYNSYALQAISSSELDIDKARAYRQLGHVLGKLGDLEGASLHLNKALVLYEVLGNTASLANTKTLLGEVKLEQGNVTRAELLTREAMGLARDIDRKDLLLPIYKLWARILSQKGMAEPAILWYQKAYDLRDSLLRLEHMNHLTRMQANMALNAKQMENAKLKQKNEGQDKQIQFQRFTIALFCIALISILVMFLMVFKNRHMLKQAYETQEYQKKEILMQAYELQEANEHISILNSQLEKKVQQRSQLILEKNKKLEKYAFDLSHSIRSPLSNVLGIIHLMKNSSRDMSIHFLEKLEESARSLDDIVRETNRNIEEGD